MTDTITADELMILIKLDGGGWLTYSEIKKFLGDNADRTIAVIDRLMESGDIYRTCTLLGQTNYRAAL